MATLPIRELYRPTPEIDESIERSIGELALVPAYTEVKINADTGELAALASDYAEEQSLKAAQQEATARETGYKIDYHKYDDPLIDKTSDSYQTISAIQDVLIGLRIDMGPQVAYEGERNKGPDNVLTRAFKNLSPAVGAWRESYVPTSGALSALYNPKISQLPPCRAKDGALVAGPQMDAMARDIFTYTDDGIAIRSRGAAVESVFMEQFTGAEATGRYPKGTEVHLASLACGAAEVIFGAAQKLNHSRPDLKITVHLADIDQLALDRAKAFIENSDMANAFAVTYSNMNILDHKALDTFQQMTKDKGFDFIDIVGFFEYLKSADQLIQRRRTVRNIDPNAPITEKELSIAHKNPYCAERFAGKAYDLLAEGGSLCAANMRDTHPRMLFGLDVVRWPHIEPRSIDKLGEIITQSCGVDPKQIKFTLPAEGANAIFSVAKS